jgi:hypothetical protein
VTALRHVHAQVHVRDAREHDIRQELQHVLPRAELEWLAASTHRCREKRWGGGGDGMQRWWLSVWECWVQSS